LFLPFRDLPVDTGHTSFWKRDRERAIEAITLNPIEIVVRECALPYPSLNGGETDDARLGIQDDKANTQTPPPNLYQSAQGSIESCGLK